MARDPIWRLIATTLQTELAQGLYRPGDRLPTEAELAAIRRLAAEKDMPPSQVIRQALSARHVPNQIFQVEAIPRTLSGKKMELPVKKLLLGAAPEQVLKRDAMANAESIDWFVAFAAARAGTGASAG